MSAPLDTRPGLHVINQLRQVHFCRSCLEAVFHRGGGELPELLCARALKEEIGIATNVIDARKADRIDTFLDDCVAPARKNAII
jgi:hypothetical protein